MYSVVLMMAISGGAEAPEFGGCRGCNGCSGCFASCSGCSGCHGCHGGLFRGRCHGCNGCNGCTSSCCAGSCHGCNGCHGGLFRRRCHGCSGCCASACTGCAGCTGGCTGGGVIIEKKDMPKGEKKTSAPATIVVTLPEGAVLTIDGNATTSTSARRTFTTPELDLNSDYVYTLRAEVVREGRNVVETQTVTVRGGRMTEVPFNFTSAGVASR